MYETNINYYTKQVEYYFLSEFSDNTIDESIDKILEIEDKPKAYWTKKTRKIIRLYYSTKKHPTDAAAYIAGLFKARLKYLIHGAYET